MTFSKVRFSKVSYSKVGFRNVGRLLRIGLSRTRVVRISQTKEQIYGIALGKP